MSLRNRYALGVLNKRVDIFSLSDSTRHDFGPYICYGCKSYLIPKLGTKNIWHFAHKVNANCSPETYLHLVGKDIFFETFSDCMKKEVPYIATIKYEENCIHHSTGKSCQRNLDKDIDLTKYFDAIDLEKPYGGFIPDIMLSSTKHNHVLFIEIAVTHKCEDNKINSGYRIIEFQINKEEDLEILKSKNIHTSEIGLEIYNFKIKRDVNLCDGVCILKEQQVKATQYSKIGQGSRQIRMCVKCDVPYETIQTTSILEREKYGHHEYLKCPNCGRTF